MQKLIIGLFFFLFVISSGCKVQQISSDSQPITHEIWDSLLQKYVSLDGKVNYKAFKKDTSLLNEYLQVVQTHHPNQKNWSEKEQLAYWINTYNAFTVKLVLDHYPVNSIKDIKNGVPFVNTVWDIKFIQIESATYDLNNIEHGIIRPTFNDPRIHFAVNCAAKSCPKLRNEAYTAEKLDEQLDDQARYFFNKTDKNKLDPKNPQLSKILSWYSIDFPKGDAFIDFVNQYAATKLDKDANITYLEYNWALNEK